MRTAIAGGHDVFHTSHLFAPVGADLTLHTHTALPALVGATALAGVPLVAAQNLVLIAGLFLNGFCAYLLVWRIVRDPGAAVIGGLVFGGSPYIAAHLNGHFNLTIAWTIPLFAIAAARAVEGSMRWSLIAGALLAVTAYIDYYYVVYQCALALCFAGLNALDVSTTLAGPSERARRASRIVLALLLADAAVILLVLTTGGFTLPLGRRTLSVHGIFNPLQAFWILAGIAIWLRLGPRVRIRTSSSWVAKRTLPAAVAVATVFLIGAAPLVWKGAGLVLRGEYVTQRYFWRSAPKGVDVATLLLGNPFHGLWGQNVQALYRRIDIDPIEAGAWFGVVPIALSAWVLRSPGSNRPAVRQWTIIGAIFFVWSLGPHLMAFGRNTGMILPQALLPYVPLVDNARVPGRAVVVSYLALAVLIGIAAAHLRQRSARGTLTLIILCCAIVVDYLPAPFPLVPLAAPRIYQVLHDQPGHAAVLELPLGMRHGMGEIGAFDDRTLFFQTIHERPLVGGFIARLPRAVAATYDNDPLLSGLLELSDRRRSDPRSPLPDRQLAGERLRACGIEFIVLDRQRASAALMDYVDRVMPLTLVAEDGGRWLFRVKDEIQ